MFNSTFTADGISYDVDGLARSGTRPSAGTVMADNWTVIKYMSMES